MVVQQFMQIAAFRIFTIFRLLAYAVLPLIC